MSADYEIVRVTEHHKFETEGVSGVNAIAILPDGQSVFTGGEDNSIVRMNVRTGELLEKKETAHAENDYDENYVWKVCVAPDVSILVSSSSSDQIVKVWSMDLEPEQSLEGHYGVNCIEISPDSTMIVIGDEEGVKIWKKGGGR